LCENSDPLAHKRARKKGSSATLTVSNPPTASPVLQVIKGMSATARNLPAASTSLLLLQGLDSADSSNDRLPNGVDIQPIDVDDSDLEDSRNDDKEKGEATKHNKTDDAELGKSPITISDLIN